MGKLVDIKSTAGLTDIKPSSASLLNIKPKMNQIPINVINRGYEVVLGTGQLMTSVPFLTYPTLGTVTQWSEIG